MIAPLANADYQSLRKREMRISRERGDATVRGGRNEGGKELRCGQPERKAATVSARANYDPTWRVKGNPICITRRAGYRHETAISPLHVYPFLHPRRLPSILL